MNQTVILGALITMIFPGTLPPDSPGTLRLISRTIYYEGHTPLESAFYTRKSGLDMMTHTTRSADNGVTWTLAKPKPDFDSNLRKGFRREIYGNWVDPIEDKLITFVLSLDVPDLDKVREPPVGQTDYYLRYRVSADGGKTYLFDEPIIQKGVEYNYHHPFRGAWVGKNGYYLGDMGSGPVRTKEGKILLPVQVGVLDKEGKITNPGGGFTYHDVVMLIGTWTKDSHLEWDVSELIQANPARSTRGMIEPTLAMMPDGRILCVMRGSNGGKLDKEYKLPSHKWHSVSSDGGRHWTKPEPWGYTDSKPFFSPSAMSQLFTHSSGRVFWIGNICQENAKGNTPRYPLVMGEVDSKTLMLIKDTVIELDTLRPEDGDGINLSHVLAIEDRATGDILIPLTRYNIGYKKGQSTLLRIGI